MLCCFFVSIVINIIILVIIVVVYILTITSANNKDVLWTYFVEMVQEWVNGLSINSHLSWVLVHNDFAYSLSLMFS